MTTSARVSLASNAVVLVLLGLAWAGLPGAPWLPYEWHKVLHVTGVVIFFGNMIVGPLWLAYAWSVDDRRHLGFAMRVLVDADVWLTAPGVLLTVVNGVFLAAAFGGVRAHPWMVEALALVAVTSLLGVTWVLPAQERLARACEAGDVTAQRRALLRWSVAGCVLMLPPSAVLWLMVAKRPLLLG